MIDDRPLLPARRPRPGSPALASDLGLSPRLVTPGEVFDSSLSPRTLAAYARTWEQWRAWCLGRAVAWHHGPPVTLGELLGELAAMGKPAAAHLAGAWLAELRDAGRKAATLAAYARALTSVTRHAAELGFLPWSLVGVVRAPRGVRVEPARRVVLGADVLGEVAARASADAVAAEDIRGRVLGAVVATLADTAIRTVELVRLRGMDVLAEGPHGGPALRLHGKGAMSAPVLHPCTQRALRALRAAGEGLSPQGPALPHPKGQRSRGDRAQGIPPGHLTRGVVRQAVEHYLPGVTPHALRHARLTAWADQGAPLHVLQKAARHRSPATTAGYLDTTADRVAELVAALDDDDATGLQALVVAESR